MQKIINFYKSILERIKSWSITKKIVYGLLFLLFCFIIFSIFRPKDNSANITTDIAKILDLKRTVLATGQVTSTTNLNLSFYKSGVVRSLRVKVGDKVKAGQILATLDQGNEQAALTSARGAVAAAEARYQKILDGASNEEIRLAEIALKNAQEEYNRVKSQQEILVENAYKNLLNSTPEARPSFELSDYTAPTISGNYTKNIEGDIKINTYQSGTGPMFSLSGIITGGGAVTTTTPQALGDSGLYINFTGVDINTVREWVISIPNKKATNYVTNYNAYQAALKTKDTVLGTAQAVITQREAELALKKSAARPADLSLAQADILSAQGQLQLASANFEHTVLRAPTSGTITKVDIKLGELATAQTSVMTLEDVENLYLEANINEANIESIKTGALVDLTFDAFGTENVYRGSVLAIEPSSTLISGVVNYKVTASIDDQSIVLRPGMTANMTILVEKKNQALAIPSRAVITDNSGRKTVRLINNPKIKTFEEIEVQTGMDADGGLIEITSGLMPSDEVVVLIKK